MQELNHIAISASAGAGKTYALTNRFIYLLHHFETPERIVALTFTRSAAGEFFQNTIEKLADAADDPSKARALSEDIGIDADCARYHELLALLIERMHKLNLQTLDSFFYRIVSAFALELGLPGNLTLLDETSEPRVRDEVRDSIVHRPEATSATTEEFWHAFNQATYGQEQRGVEAVVSRFLEELYTLYLEAPDDALWGRTERIWPNGCPWKIESIDWNQLADRLLETIPDDLGKSQSKSFHAAAEKIRNYPVEEKTNTVLDRALAQADEVLNGNTTLQAGSGKNNHVPIQGPACAALADALRALVWHHLSRALENTRGVYRILHAYHSEYERLVRRPGRLCFSDLTQLLAPDSPGAPLQKTDPAARQLMDFRLDARFDHWLFDEFQDTSRAQWKVVANLIDEIVQDNSGERSFFYVGDTKQCLYLWRNSDDRLFHEIIRHYSPAIQSETRSCSWRSAPAILDAVNTVFDNTGTIAECFTPAVAERWARAWSLHEASPRTRELPGYACWLRATDKEEENTRNAQILRLLENLRPLEKGISVGILVRKNEQAGAIADYLRTYGNIPIHTGSALQPGTDNAAGAALLALLRLATHPGDRHAGGYLRLIDVSTPGDALVPSAPELRRRLLEGSGEDAIRWASARIAEHLPEEDLYHRQRLDRLIAAARRFDQDERTDLDSLYYDLQAARTGDCSPGNAVIIDTIHKAKGLEYDLVILAEEEKTSSLTPDHNITACRNDAGEPDWILQPLKKDLMQADPQLGRLKEQAESLGGFEALCRLYVAMTRARQGLYIISDCERAAGGSLVHFLCEQLGGGSYDATDTPLFNDAVFPLIWETGCRDWHRHFQSEPPAEGPEPPAAVADFAPAAPRLQLARPSAGKSYTLPLSTFFDLEEQSGAFGTSVHAAFEKIEWLDEDAPAPVNKEEAVQNVLRACFEDAAIRKLFTKPEGNPKLWRERSFTYVENGQCVNGVFDRVVLYRDTSGKPERAEIIDFKTSHIENTATLKEAAEQHRPQLDSYRKALARITGLPEKSITPRILFTQVPALVEL
ncbi:MAG: UvrD-helicase domain-containing protein [Opitutales bacterium]